MAGAHPAPRPCTILPAFTVPLLLIFEELFQLGETEPTDCAVSVALFATEIALLLEELTVTPQFVAVRVELLVRNKSCPVVPSRHTQVGADCPLAATARAATITVVAL